MHLVDGVLSAPVLIGSSALAVGGVAVGLRSLTPDKIPMAGMCAAVFFVASLIHVPLGPSSAHLIMGGLAGWLLGFAAFPALLVALLLQAVFFGFGGLVSLGANTVILAGPAVLFGWVAQMGGNKYPVLSGFLVGAGALLGSALVCAALLGLSGEAFLPLAKVLVWAHLPLAGIEGAITAAATAFLMRVLPQALPSALPANAQLAKS